MQDQDFKRLIERVKLSSPIEAIVQERLPELKRAGSLWEACCPFHEERSPSFKVDPRRQTWHCFGACGEGGDVIHFLERFDGLNFREVLEQLASRAGIELPRFGGGGRKGEDDDPLYEILERAAAFYAKQLHSEEGRAALAYARGRGIADATLEAFGAGWAPARGNPILNHARRAGIPEAQLLKVGLVRASDSGELYDFFRGRWMIPIRTRTGRVAGFGARSVPDAQGREAAGPKYVNTPETPVFHKGRLVYGFDRAQDHVRKQRHLILVEGYTDVMAAHQVGLGQVAAVLGTATTEDHAALVRRSGARRVTLVFDGDAAGRKATLRALAGFLPLDLDIDVIAPPEGRDPCDLLLADGPERFLELLEGAQAWFDFALDGLRGLPPRELATQVDTVLELLSKLNKPVDRDARLSAMARYLELPEAGIREQWNEVAARDAARRSAPRGAAHRSSAPQSAASSPSPSESDGAIDRRAAELPPAEPTEPEQRPPSKAEMRPFADLLGAVLVDESLLPLAREALGAAPRADLRKMGQALCELYDDVDDDRPIDAARLIDALGDDPARRHVVPMLERANRASSALELAQGALACLERRKREQEIERRKLELQVNQQSGLGGEQERDKLQALHRRLQETRRKPSGQSATASASPNV